MQVLDRVVVELVVPCCSLLHMKNISKIVRQKNVATNCQLSCPQNRQELRQMAYLSCIKQRALQIRIYTEPQIAVLISTELQPSSLKMVMNIYYKEQVAKLCLYISV